MLALVNVVAAFAIQFLPFGQIIFAIAILYTGGNILSVIVSAFFLRRLLGHLDGPRIANSYIRMGYAALGSAIAAALALWLMGSYSADGFAWSNRPAALVTIVVVGPIMLAVYLFLLKIFHVTELRDLLQPLLGRLRRGPAAEPGPRTPAAGAAAERPTPGRATVSVDTGLIPRISGEFDAASFRAGPDLRGRDDFPDRACCRPGRRLSAGGGPAGHRAGRPGARRHPAAGTQDLPGPGRAQSAFPVGTEKEKIVFCRRPPALLTWPGPCIG